MEKNEIKNEISYYMMYLTNCFTNYVLCERIMDWYEKNKDSLSKSKLFFSFTTNALKEKWIIQFVSLFISKEEKSIIKFCNFIQSASPKVNTWITDDLKKETLQLLNSINENQLVINKAKAWRDQVFAHNDNFLFDNEKCEIFKKENPTDEDKINDLIYKAYSSLNNCLSILGFHKVLFKYSNLLDIDETFSKISNIKKPNLTIDLDKFN